MKIFNLYALDTRTGTVRTVCENKSLWGGMLIESNGRRCFLPQPAAGTG